jgi:hypothetical protein
MPNRSQAGLMPAEVPPVKVTETQLGELIDALAALLRSAVTTDDQ